MTLIAPPIPPPSRASSVRSFIVRQSCLTAGERETMLALHCRHFDGVESARFQADLCEKEWVILLRDGERLVGFSTLVLLSLEYGGSTTTCLFSGDTIVEPAYWGQQALAGAFGQLLLRFMRRFGQQHLYWFLISKGYRTYRFLPVFFQRFTPHPDLDSPELERILRAVAQLKFKEDFEEKSGLVIPRSGGDRLRPELCAVPEARQQDAFVRYFLRRNPDYHLGHELACLAPISRTNLKPMAWRVIERALPAWIE